MALLYLLLRLKAMFFRLLFRVAVRVNYMGEPKPSKPSKTIGIRSRALQGKPEIDLLFYTPERAYAKHELMPCIINFHGGGYTIGSPSDDARWATSVTESVGAIVISVGYRLAPEHPHPAAIEDGVDALNWIISHAGEMRIDRNKIAISGFSAGGNLSFAVLFAWHEQREKLRLERGKTNGETVSSPDDSAGRTSNPSQRVLISDPPHQSPLEDEHLSQGSPVAAVVTWYPNIDKSRTQAERRASNPGGPEKSIPPVLTHLFDAAYTPGPPTNYDFTSPYLSPGLANDELLRTALPDDIVIYTCEWDGLCAEAETFRKRLVGVGKRVSGMIVPRVQHGITHSPKAWGVDPARDELYEEACQRLKAVFRGEPPDRA